MNEDKKCYSHDEPIDLLRISPQTYSFKVLSMVYDYHYSLCENVDREDYIHLERLIPGGKVKRRGHI
jgi:hypothetical protein